MRIVIFCDMEGISGIWRQEQVTKDSPAYREACAAMTHDVNACIGGCLAGGATSITVRDVHAQCGNVHWEALDSRVDYLVMGDPGMQRFDCLEGCDGLILLGYHAMAGTPRAILSHTATRAWQNCWLNGEKVGEFGLDAARAGEHGVPVIMTSGDDTLCAEARSLIGNVVTVEVKVGRARESARLLAKEKALARIHDGALKAAQHLEDAEPLKIRPPVTVRVEFTREIPPALRLPGIGIIDGRTCEATRDTVEDAVNALIG